MIQYRLKNYLNNFSEFWWNIKEIRKNKRQKTYKNAEKWYCGKHIIKYLVKYEFNFN